MPTFLAFECLSFKRNIFVLTFFEKDSNFQQKSVTLLSEDFSSYHAKMVCNLAFLLAREPGVRFTKVEIPVLVSMKTIQVDAFVILEG